jgi:PST family polysaccharide transporter
MSLRDKTLTGLFWSATEKWGRRLISLAVFTLLARLLEPSAFGLVSLAGVYIAFLRTFVEQGFVAALVQRENLRPGHLDTAFWINTVFSVAMAVLTLIFAEPVARLFGEPELAGVIRWISPVFVLKGLSAVQQGLFRRNLEFQVLSVRTVASTITGGVVGVVMAFQGYGVWSLVGKQLTAQTVGMAALWTASDWRPRLYASYDRFKELFSFSAYVMGGNLLNFANRRSDDLLIGAFLGSTALGYYTIAYRLLRVMTKLFSKVVTQVTFSAFSRMQDDPERMRKTFYRATNLMAALAVPLFMGACVTAPELVPALFGEQWMPSVPVMQVLAFIGVLHTVFYFNGNVINSMGKSDWMFGLSALNAVVNVAGFFLAVWWWGGIVAVAVAYVGRAYLMAPLELWAVRKLISIEYSTYLRQFAVPAVGAAAMVGAVIALRALLEPVLGPYLLLGALVASGAVVYTTVVLLLKPSYLTELKKLIGGLVSALKKERA